MRQWSWFWFGCGDSYINSIGTRPGILVATLALSRGDYEQWQSQKRTLGDASVHQVHPFQVAKYSAQAPSSRTEVLECWNRLLKSRLTGTNDRLCALCKQLSLCVEPT